MKKICATENPNFPIPNLDFSHAPVGIDIFKVRETGILPVIDGGMIDKNGGWMGAGCARIPEKCFLDACAAFEEKYGKTEA